MEDIASIATIKELIAFAREQDADQHAEIKLGRVGNMQGQAIKKETGIAVNFAERIVSASAIRHICKRHDLKNEDTTRGQVPVEYADFEKLQAILSEPDCVLKADNSARGDLALKFIKAIGAKEYHVIMSVLFKKGVPTIVLTTMYIKTKPAR